MSTVLEKARGAAAFSDGDRDIRKIAESSAAFFVRQVGESEWEDRIEELKGFRSLEEDWDGDGSLPPGPELADGAIAFAQSLQKDGVESPDRVVVGVNGTIYFEWHDPVGYYELEVYSPVDAEARWVRNDSDEVVVSTVRRS